MSAPTPELDPVAIRKSLVKARIHQTPWPKAWADATNHHAVSEDDRTVYAFMETNFRAAYFDTASSRGRCRVAERDVSSAVGVRVQSDVERPYVRCQSGDVCSLPATHGRFRPMFCADHHAGLAKIAARFSLEIGRADPRNGGNKSLYTHKAA